MGPSIAWRVHVMTKWPQELGSDGRPGPADMETVPHRGHGSAGLSLVFEGALKVCQRTMGQEN